LSRHNRGDSNRGEPAWCWVVQGLDLFQSCWARHRQTALDVFPTDADFAEAALVTTGLCFRYAIALASPGMVVHLCTPCLTVFNSHPAADPQAEKFTVDSILEGIYHFRVHDATEQVCAL
jgi:hypothetical protein